MELASKTVLGAGSEGVELEIVEQPGGWFGTLELTRGLGENGSGQGWRDRGQGLSLREHSP